jgi:hypothetical protein
LIRKPDDTSMLNRRQFEVCVFSYLAAEVQSGDICIAGSESFADHRQQLLPWQECAPLIEEYCNRMELPDNAAEFTNNLRTLLTEKAAAVDQKYPQNGELTINSAGEPVLSRVTAREIPESAIMLQGQYHAENAHAEPAGHSRQYRALDQFYPPLRSPVGGGPEDRAGRGTLYTNRLRNRL